MRIVCAAVCVMCAFSTVAFAGEPFGLRTRDPSPDMRVLKQQLRTVYATEIRRIAASIADKGLGWLNRAVQMSGVIGLDNHCLTKAMAKCEVARLQGYECRIVEGLTRATRIERGMRITHAMAAVKLGEQWRMLDNQHVIAHFLTPTDSELTTFRGSAAFYPHAIYKY